MRCWVTGTIRDAAGEVLATCDATLADMQQLWELQTPGASRVGDVGSSMILSAGSL